VAGLFARPEGFIFRDAPCGIAPFPLKSYQLWVQVSILPSNVYRAWAEHPLH
jgi:hypothetical protein